MSKIKSLIVRSLLKSPKKDTIKKPFALKHANKITIVGTGAVGMATAFALLAKGISNDIVLIGRDKNIVKGEVMDLQHGSLFVKNAHINGGTDYSLSKDSRVCIVTAGARQKKDQSRLSLIQTNADIVKTIIPELLKYSPETIILMVTNPVDVLTYVAWKISDMPKHKIFGSGTNLDSARFRALLSQKLGISPSSCHGQIIGEHGDSSIALWSRVNVSGIQLREIKPTIATKNDDEEMIKIHKEVVNAAYNIIKLKGYTSWAVALSLADITECIFRDSASVRQLSVSVKGFYGIEDDVFMSISAVLEADGVTGVIEHILDDIEKKQFRQSAALIKKVTDGIKL